MKNPNCPDSQYPEFNPATGECFNTQTVERTYHQYQQDTPAIASRSLVLIAIGATIGFVISRKTR
jgi:hypothetical protein